VRERLEDPSLPGAFQPTSWREFSVLVHRSEDDGIAVVIEANGGLAVYMRADGRIFRIGAGPSGIEARPWSEPNALRGLGDLPRMVLAFTKCADPIL
jgi:hypothetical protein